MSDNIIHVRIHESKRITFKNFLKKPCLRKHYKTLRLKEAKKTMHFGDKWLSVISINCREKVELGWIR